jgi:beta-galactosidase
MHHDLGCLGSAVHVSALRRQIRILMEMGVNSIRTSHNPPSPELLSLCDEMGLVVMDEMFDMWKKSKTPFDYSRHWDEWHVRDLQDFVRRDRNHPSVIMWSIGNEILEQWDSTGTPIAKELAGIVHALDTSRPLTSGCNDPRPENFIIQSGVLDLIGFNYKHEQFESFPQTFPGKKFIGTETGSALATRGHYDMPSDSIRRWPIRWDIPFTQGNPDNTVSAYDNVSAPWGSTHEETWKLMKKHDYLSGMYYWTGFDYLGEPTPYGWPSRSSYFGIVDLAGFPKDAYYMYQSEWTDKTVLHVFPHWNWQPGKVVDVWAYYNQADEVELFLNGTSLGVKRKEGDDLHVMWRVPFEAGTLKAVSRKNGNTVMEREVKTAGNPASLVLESDKSSYEASANDLAFVTVKIVDENGTVVPDASNLVEFEVDGGASVKAVDNGDPVSHESFIDTKRKAFHGLALVVIQKNGKKGDVRLTASSEGLPATSVLLKFE